MEYTSPAYPAQSCPKLEYFARASIILLAFAHVTFYIYEPVTDLCAVITLYIITVFDVMGTKINEQLLARHIVMLIYQSMHVDDLSRHMFVLFFFVILVHEHFLGPRASDIIAASFLVTCAVICTLEEKRFYVPAYIYMLMSTRFSIVTYVVLGYWCLAIVDLLYLCGVFR
jgi:hypothetical protein